MTQDIVPFRQFVLKVHSRCDLACNHCYIYEHSDQSWRGRPKDGISSETAAFAAQRIAEHAAAHQLPEVHVILHGGEPLLLGVERTREVVTTLTEAIAPVTRLVLRMHTNGVLLSDEYLDLLAEYDVKIGVSLDGGRAANDLHRLDRRGQSSYERVIAALALLRKPEYVHLYSGLLCTIDIENDPVEAYLSLLEQEPPRIDFLLPHSTWEHQPSGLVEPRDLAHPMAGPTPYGQWLGEIFALWNRTGRPVPIRTFDSVVAALHGRPSGTESLGLVPADLLVIETDGTLEQADSLKTAFDGAPATGFDVQHNSLDEAAAHAGITARQQGLDGLCGVCRACPVAEVCGGGLYAHRYSPGSGFDNPSVFCADLSDLIGRIRAVEVGHVGSPAIGPVAIPAAAEPAATAHVLSRADFDALAAGYGEVSAIDALAETQRSIRRDLLARLAVFGPQDDRLFTAAWDRLATLDADRPDLVDQALAHPYVRAWAVRYLEDPGGRVNAGDAAHLAAITAGAYLRGGLPTSLTVPVRAGLVHLPGLGALRVSDGAAEAVVEILSEQRVSVSASGETWMVDLADSDSGSLWQPLRRLRAAGLSAALEDLDPYRDCHGSPELRLSAAEFEHWQSGFADAVAFVDVHLPRYAAGLRAGLATVAPVTATADGSSRAGAARHAFGAVGSVRPKDPALFGLQLVCGIQQMKIGALLDLYDFLDSSDVEPRQIGPWSPDPYSLTELLQETYAQLAVTEFWRARRQDGSGEAGLQAEVHFDLQRTRTAEAVGLLLASESLTALGEQFVRAMGETVAPWLDEPVSGSVLMASQRSAADYRAGLGEPRRAGR